MVVWVGEIMNSMVLAWLQHFGNQGQRGGLKQTKDPFQLAVQEWANILAGWKLVIDNVTIYIRKDDWVIHRCPELLVFWGQNPPWSPVQGKGFLPQTEAWKLFHPCSTVVRGKGFMPSLHEGMSELHGWTFHNLSICGGWNDWWIGILLELASWNRLGDCPLRPCALAHSFTLHLGTCSIAWCCCTLRRCGCGGQDRLSRLHHVSLYWPEKPRACLAWHAGSCLGYAFQHSQVGDYIPDWGSVSGNDFSWTLHKAETGSGCKGVWMMLMCRKWHLPSSVSEHGGNCAQHSEGVLPLHTHDARQDGDKEWYGNWQWMATMAQHWRLAVNGSEWHGREWHGNEKMNGREWQWMVIGSEQW